MVFVEDMLLDGDRFEARFWQLSYAGTVTGQNLIRLALSHGMLTSLDRKKNEATLLDRITELLPSQNDGWSAGA